MDKARKEKLVRYGLFGLAGLIVSPVIFLAIKGIIGLAIAALVLGVIVTFAPVVSMKLTNAKIKSIKGEAARNPVETMQAQWIMKQAQLNERAAAVTAFNTEYLNFESRVQGYAAKRPAKAEAYRNQQTKMKFVLDRQLAGLADGRKKLDDFQQLISEASDDWDMALAGQRMNAASAKFEAPDPIEFMKQQTALNSIQSALNQVIAELDTSLALDYNTIEMPAQAYKMVPTLNSPAQTNAQDALVLPAYIKVPA